MIYRGPKTNRGKLLNHCIYIGRDDDKTIRNLAKSSYKLQDENNVLICCSREKFEDSIVWSLVVPSRLGDEPAKTEWQRPGPGRIWQETPVEEQFWWKKILRWFLSPSIEQPNKFHPSPVVHSPCSSIQLVDQYGNWIRKFWDVMVTNGSIWQNIITVGQ